MLEYLLSAGHCWVAYTNHLQSWLKTEKQIIVTTYSPEEIQFKKSKWIAQGHFTPCKWWDPSILYHVASKMFRTLLYIYSFLQYIIEQTSGKQRDRTPWRHCLSNWKRQEKNIDKYVMYVLDGGKCYKGELDRATPGQWWWGRGISQGPLSS